MQQSQLPLIFESDEPFRIRDIEFNDPDIVILRATTSQIGIKVAFIINILDARFKPFAGTVELRHALEKSRNSAVFERHDENRAAIWLTLVQHDREAPGGLCCANQPRHFQFRWDPA